MLRTTTQAGDIFNLTSRLLIFICIFRFFVPCATDVSTPVSVPETPNQLATDRATLAQEEEDSVQQQDNDDIGMLMYFVILRIDPNQYQLYMLPSMYVAISPGTSVSCHQPNL